MNWIASGVKKNYRIMAGQHNCKHTWMLNLLHAFIGCGIVSLFNPGFLTLDPTLVFDFSVFLWWGKVRATCLYENTGASCSRIKCAPRCHIIR